MQHSATLFKQFNELLLPASSAAGRITACVLNESSKYCQKVINPLYLFCLSTDIDECATQMHYCQSNTVCVNLPGSHRCDCLPGFIRVDEYSCTGMSACMQHMNDSESYDGESFYYVMHYVKFNGRRGKKGQKHQLH